MGKGIGGHHRAFQGDTDDWLTPPDILSAIGHFDLDPCCPEVMPWKTADRMIQLPESGLLADWRGRVFCNPPYGPQTGEWLERLAHHGDGIALIFARTETAMFFKHVWNKAHAILFLEGRLHFYRPDGQRAKHNSGGPSCLVAYGHDNAEKLQEAMIKGHFVRLRLADSERVT